MVLWNQFQAPLMPVEYNFREEMVKLTLAYMTSDLKCQGRWTRVLQIRIQVRTEWVNKIYITQYQYQLNILLSSVSSTFDV